MTPMNEIFPLCANKQAIRILGNFQRALPAKFNQGYEIVITITQRTESEDSRRSVLFEWLQMKSDICCFSGKKSTSGKQCS